MWYQKFDTYIQQVGYNRSDSDSCMYIRKLAEESHIYLILNVNNKLIIDNDEEEIGKLKQSLHQKFSMRELGEARHIRGMPIERNRMKKALRLS